MTVKELKGRLDAIPSEYEVNVKTVIVHEDAELVILTYEDEEEMPF